MQKIMSNYLNIGELHKKVNNLRNRLINEDKALIISSILALRKKGLNNNSFYYKTGNKESVYFKNLLLKEKRVILGLHKKGEKYDKRKMKNIKVEKLSSRFSTYRKAVILNDRNKIFSHKLKIKNQNINNFIGIKEDKFRFINLFKKSKILNNFKQEEVRNIVEERYSDIVSRKMENKLKVPHYFFPTPYISRGMTSQLRSWPNTVYNYLKPTMRNIKYLDLLTTRLIELFFNVVSIKRRTVLGKKLYKGLDAISIKPISIFVKYLNEIIRFTSLRAINNLKDFNFNSNEIVTFSWFKDEVRWTKALKKFIKERRKGKVISYLPKRKIFFNKARRILLSKPLFRHTGFNVIVDLFIYYNKSYKIGKYYNMLKTRALYKYMYSMYVNYIKIVQDIMSRPRIFYINVIDPKVYYYYFNIIDMYEKILIHNSKRQFILLLLSILKWNSNNKLFSKNSLCLNLLNWFNFNNNKLVSLSDKNIFSLDNNTSFEVSNSFGKWIYMKFSSRNDNIKVLRLKNKIYKFRSLYNKNKENVFLNDFIFKLNNMLPLERKKRAILGNIEYVLPHKQDVRINKVLIRKQHLEEMERKARTPVNLKDYTLWSRIGLGKHLKKEVGKIRRIKIFGKDKFTLNRYIRKLGKGKKWSKLSPKYLEQEIMKYNLFSVTQKRNINPNEKWVYDKKTNTKVHIKKYLKNPFIFDKKNTKGNKLEWNSKSNNIKHNMKYGKTKFNNKINVDKFSRSNNYFFNDRGNNRNLHTIIKHKDNLNRKISSIYRLNNIKKLLLGRLNKRSSVYKTDKLFLMDESKLSILKEKRIVKYNFNKIERLLKYKYWLNKLYMYWKIKNISNNKIRNINYIKYLQSLYFNEKEIKLKIPYLSLKVKESLEINNFDMIYLNNKILWDKLDYSVIKLIVKLLKNHNKFTKNNLEVMNNKNKSDKISKVKKINKYGYINKNLNRTDDNLIYEYLNYSYGKLVGKIKKLMGKNDRWYIERVKQEFYNINRDVLVSKTLNVVCNDINNFNSLYNYGNYTNYLYNDCNFKLKSKEGYAIRIWQTSNLNNREENLINKLRFSDKVFKPYYRYMIRLFIFNEYKLFISKLGYKNLLMHFYIPMVFTKFNWFKNNNINILNFVAVKTLFNLFAFNYRSLFILKPKYYYINKARYYKRKARTLNINTWLRSFRYLKALRKAPNNFWLRFHKLLNFYYFRILNFAKWDTERKVLLPYVLYFEDLLYNIYGKWALIRIWPLKRYFLSSYILAERLMLLLDTKANYSKRRRNITSLFTRFVFKFINLLNLSKIDKVYEFNLENKSKWPNELIKIIDKPLSQNQKYNKLEYHSDKFDISFTFNTYFIKNTNLDFYLPIIKNYYYNSAKYFDSNIKRSKRKLFKLNLKYRKGFVKFWTRPLKSYILNITKRQDISGVEFRLAGKARSRPRAFNLIYQRGSFLGARHYNDKVHKYLTFSSSYIRNTLKSTMDYTLRVGNFKPGTTTLKLWYASLLSSDIIELLLYLSKMKVIYNAILNRYFIVPKRIKDLVLYYNLSRKFRKQRMLLEILKKTNLRSRNIWILKNYLGKLYIEDNEDNKETKEIGKNIRKKKR